MKKEVLLAITIGFIIGLVLTFFVYKSQLGRNASSEILSPLSSGEVSTKVDSLSEKSLTIIAPIDQSISSEGKTTITGSNSPLSWVLIMGEKGEKVVQADEKGNFETDLLLVSGENEITVTAIKPDGTEISKTLTIVYSTAEI